MTCPIVMCGESKETVVFRVLAALVVVASSLVLNPTAQAAPPGGVALVQSSQGTATGVAFTASLRKATVPGNSVLIMVGLNGVATRGAVEPDDVASVIGASETAAAFGVDGAPYGVLYAAHATGTRTWGFHLATPQKVTWMVAEYRGLQQFDPSGVPMWDGAAFSSAYALNSTTLNTGQGTQTRNTSELLVSMFVARADAVPTSAEFSTGWSRLGSATTSGTGTNHRLDVAVRVVNTVGVYDCTATYGAPANLAGSITGFAA